MFRERILRVNRNKLSVLFQGREESSIPKGLRLSWLQSEKAGLWLEPGEAREAHGRLSASARRSPQTTRLVALSTGSANMLSPSQMSAAAG